MEKVLVIDSGGRGHALARQLGLSPHVGEVWCAPGNGGTATERKCRNVAIPPTDIKSLIGLAEQERFDLTVVGPEAPLVAGIADLWPGPIFGPKRDNAMLEGSKIETKMLLTKLGIPTASFEALDRPCDAFSYLHRQSTDFRCVVKADGLCAGKGVLICNDRGEALKAVERMMLKKEFGSAGERVIIEARLDSPKSWELSAMFLCAPGGDILALDNAQDYKRAEDGNLGPNTGGMGSFSPVSRVTPALSDHIYNKIALPIVEATDYTGILYLGLMITENGPQVLEINVRLGDPEAEVILPRMQNDLFEVMHTAATTGRFPCKTLSWSPQHAVTVIMAAGSYPASGEKGHVITGIDDALGLSPNLVIFHAGDKFENNQYVVNGGRVLAVTGFGETRKDAAITAYHGVTLIHWKGCKFRTDIGD
jgi:phosphoribosylamine---glycine ligase